ncbi:AAC(3) family N-acetyltransferase [Streptomyces sp. ICN441]|uniref:AAC(3) family N-acetyltransferase n=1 Tax=Streptomyces tirandamycinicus TaxID=2174846 RepID=A0A2S1SQB2_9ACTN|nr:MULTISPECIES: AAC(3) family N-acetyltransferase [Streptomyces]AWI28566.1 AAC(3) family N-acetyltransferase [Streptomyces tirandamycinicus]TFE56137.1 AAC(3) family N-acetyltransferase [Streptomyces sp. ICN441]
MTGTLAERDGLTRQLTELGLRTGETVLVHAGLGGTGIRAAGLRDALLRAVGEEGTLVVPAFTAGNSDTSSAHLRRVAGMTPTQAAAFRATMPAFDPATTPSTGMGRLAECVRTAPGAVRSAHPQTSFAALGRRAAELLSRHPLTCHLGEESPLGALYRAGARVLMINVGFSVCTAFHLAEYRIGAPLRRYACVVRGAHGPTWTEYLDVELDDRDFEAIGAAFSWNAERRTQLGGTTATLFSITDAVDHAVTWMSEKRR